MDKKLIRPVWAEEKHNAFSQELIQLLYKYCDEVSAQETLAVAAQVTGKILALQNPLKATADALSELISVNIKFGHYEMVQRLSGDMGEPQGSA